MTQRRRSLLMVFGLASFAAACWWGSAGPPPGPPGVTRANAYRLRPGMSLEDVEAILGPHGTLTSSGHVCAACWCRDDLSIWVSFQADQAEAVMATLMERQPDGTAKGVTLFEPQEPLLDRVRRWLHL